METIRIGDKKVAFLDQRKLPEETIYLECGSWQEVAAAIKQMVVRGAPAIGAAAAFGMALAAFQYNWQEEKEFRANLERAAKAFWQPALHRQSGLGGGKNGRLGAKSGRKRTGCRGGAALAGSGTDCRPGRCH